MKTLFLSVLSMVIAAGAMLQELNAQQPVINGYVAVIDGFSLRAKDSKIDEYTYVLRANEIFEKRSKKTGLICVPVFSADLSEENFPETKIVIERLRRYADHVQLIAMLEDDPQDPAKRDAVIKTLHNVFVKSTALGCDLVASTSFEAWMKGTENGQSPLTGKDLDAVVELLIDIHVQAITKAKADGSKVKFLDMEYLRTIEFVTFTNAELAWRVVNGINQKLGYVFVRFLDDTAHAKNSGLALDKINTIRAKAKAAGSYGTFHFSEPTTRGRIGDSGTYVVEGLHLAAKHGKLSIVLTEVFPQTIGPMLEKIPGHKKVTYTDNTEVIVHGLNLAEAELQKLAAQGLISFTP